MAHQIFDIVFHAAPVTVVGEFGQVVLRHNAEFSNLGQRVNLGIPQRVSPIAIRIGGSCALLKNLADAFLAWKRRALPAGAPLPFAREVASKPMLPTNCPRLLPL